MPWAKLDDQFFYNKKIAQVDGPAKLLYIAGLVYASNQLTDGFIPERAVKFIASTADVANCHDFARQLLDVGLWVATDDGYQINDYLEWNPSKEQVERTRAARAEAGQRGGLTKAAKSKQNPSKLLSKTLAKSKQNSSNEDEQTDSEADNLHPKPAEAPVRAELTQNPSKLLSKTLAKSKQNLTPSPSPSPKERATRARATAAADETLASVGVVVYREVVNLTPNKEQRALIAAAVTDGDKWRGVLKDWLAHGWNPKNVPGQLEKYAALNGHGPAPTLPRNDAMDDPQIAFIRRMRGETE